MNKNDADTAKPALKSTLTFFTGQLTDINNRRMQINRSKGLARYFAQSRKDLRNLSPLDTTLGVMSFVIYALRFTTNLSLLIQLDAEDNKQRNDLYYALFNDSIWGLVNLTQFFWLSYKNSTTSGLQGMRLETLAMLIDVIVMLIRYQQDQEEYLQKYHQASPLEQARLAIEWRNKELHFIRAMLTGLCMFTIFGLFSFSVPIPFSPLISVIVITSSLLRVAMDNEKDKQLIHLYKLHQTNPLQVRAKEQEMTVARLNEINQIILHSAFLPLGIFALLTTPLSVTFGAWAGMLLMHHLLKNLIDTLYSEEENNCSEHYSRTAV